MPRENSGLVYGSNRENPLGISLYEDAELYRMKLRQDAEIYEELYGISPFDMPQMHLETLVLLNGHATVLASGKYEFTPMYQQAFEEFIAALKVAQFPLYDYFRWNLSSDIEDRHPVLMRLRERHWAFDRAFQNEVRYVCSKDKK
ncbi:hypothetical protein BDV26DRAFT_298868 [Aspergillus bertholletiae]|uniref:Uncharacterized protein n=1 Tax=Aspergillus bertholletiae TaxID=1226010 RepID=A0A5N7AN99_9EURO|nr:hypothetical protein BDV26DRAFT_298868 [Aspergillus bertholletiae]